jgi:proteasome-associated ATPase
MTATKANHRQAAPLMPDSLEDALALADLLHETGESLQPLVRSLLEEKHRLLEALGEVRERQEQLRGEIEALCAPERYLAVVTAVPDRRTSSVEVVCGNARMQVAVHPDVPLDRLHVGARGMLSRGRNCLLQVQEGAGEWQDLGTFESYLPEGRRLLLRYQEQLIAVTAAESLEGVALRKGDLVGFDTCGPGLAYCRVEPPGRQELFFENTPSDRFEELGGLDEEIAQLQRIIRFRLQHAELAGRYRLKSKRGILLQGPPGNGKTKLARCLARFIAELTPGGECRFMAVAGSSDYSMWLGQSEQKLIARFDAARELATRSQVPVVLFFDEIDAIGRRRGTDAASSAPDRILATFLAQLDGVQEVNNLVIVGATNRADILDPGLLRPGRLGDVKILLPPPGRAAAQAILGRYLHGLPLAGEEAPVTSALLSRIYSERGDYAEVALVSLRDGRKVVVRGRDLVSGAMLENVVRTAAETAADREAHAGAAGVSEDDLAGALDRELRGVACLLTPANVRSYVPRLPQEVDPVAVEPLLRGLALAAYVRSA